MASAVAGRSGGPQWLDRGSAGGEWGTGFMQFWADHIKGVNGRSWASSIVRAAVVTLVPDASKRGYGAHELGGQY